MGPSGDSIVLNKHAIRPYSDFRKVYLCDADLSGANLQGGDFRKVNLTGADLRGTNLRFANLWHANLTGADLSGADLSGTDLSGTNLRFAKFTADQLMWLTLTGQITPDQAARCTVLETQD